MSHRGVKSFYSGAKLIEVPELKLRQWFNEGKIRAFYYTNSGAPRFTIEDLEKLRLTHREASGGRDRAGGIDQVIDNVKRKIARRYYAQHVDQARGERKTKAGNQ